MTDKKTVQEIEAIIKRATVAFADLNSNKKTVRCKKFFDSTVGKWASYIDQRRYQIEIDVCRLEIGGWTLRIYDTHFKLIGFEINDWRGYTNYGIMPDGTRVNETAEGETADLLKYMIDRMEK